MNLFKACLCSTAFIFLITSAVAQTGAHRLGISAGGGPLDFASNVGNGFSLKKGNSWHGAALVQVSSYLSQSFDLVFFGSVGDLGSLRLKAVGVSLKYKLADGHFLKEESTIKPYIYLGTSFNNVSDRVKLKYVPDGNYMSVNAGLGVRYYFSERIHIGYNLAFGYFLANHAEFSSRGHSPELYIHNALMVGIDI